MVDPSPRMAPKVMAYRNQPNSLMLSTTMMTGDGTFRSW